MSLHLYIAAALGLASVQVMLILISRHYKAQTLLVSNMEQTCEVYNKVVTLRTLQLTNTILMVVLAISWL